MNIKKYFVRGFTITELLVSIAIIAILASVTFVVYRGIQASARDVSVQSDLDRMESLQISYGIKHNTAGKAYYSGNGPDSDLAFTPSEGNAIKVVVNSADYCIRGYNPLGNKNSISNSYYKESTVNICSSLDATRLPTIPQLVVSSAGGAIVVATITPTSTICSGAGTAQYGFKWRIDGGTWTEFSSWSALLTSSQTANYGVTYDYQVQTRCYSDDNLISSTVLTPVVSYTYNPLPPLAPTVTVGLSGSDIQATISSSDSCSAGINEEYAFDYYTNAGSWVGFSAFSSSKSITLTPSQGVQYTYRAQARCIINSTPSTTTVGLAGLPYVAAINAPSAPAISFSAPDWQWTNWTWSATCPSGTNGDYQIHYYNDYADSGWILVGSDTLASRQTSRYEVNYYMQLQARCKNSYATGSWSATSVTSPASYYRNAPTIRALIVAGGGGGGYDNGGGGGGGGVIDASITVTQAMQQTTYFGVVIGGGGGPQANGNPSSFMGYTSYGGGRGGNARTYGTAGGSGGGGGGNSDKNIYGGTANQPGGYANIGGMGGWRNGSSCGDSGTYYAAGGGGGAGDRGGDAWSGGGGPGQMQGGAGYLFNNGQRYAAGGGGGGDNCYWGNGGSGGGGNGAAGRGATGGNASYYGSGGGGGSGRSGQGGYGYSGIVIIQSGDGSIPNVTYGSDNTLTVSGYY